MKPAPRAARPRAAVLGPAVRAPVIHERAAGEPTKTPRRALGRTPACASRRSTGIHRRRHRIAMAIPYGAGKPVCLSTVRRLRSVGHMDGKGLTWKPGLSSGRLNRCTFRLTLALTYFQSATRSFRRERHESSFCADELDRRELVREHQGFGVQRVGGSTADRPPNRLKCQPRPDALAKRFRRSRARHLAIRQPATTDNDDSAHRALDTPSAVPRNSSQKRCLPLLSCYLTCTCFRPAAGACI